MIMHNRNKALKRAISMAFLEKGKRIEARKILEQCGETKENEDGSESERKLLVTICYCHPWLFDKDNLIASLKHAIDSVADNLIPGLAPGRADDDSRLEFACIQKQTLDKNYNLNIRIEPIWKGAQNVQELHGIRTRI